MMSSAAVLLKTSRASRKRFRARAKTVRLPVGIAVRLQPGIPFAFTPESFSRSPRNPFRLAPESAYRTARLPSTRARWPVDGSSRLVQYAQHQPQRGGIDARHDS